MRAVAHRGASGYAPENTVAAFDLAVEMDAGGIETDLRLTRDGIVVLVHDATVDRITDGKGAVASLRFADLQVLDAGRWFHPRFGGLRILDLRSFLKRYMGRTWLELELKAPEAVGPALDEVQRVGMWDGVVFTSFQYAVLEAVRRRAQWAQIGWLVPRISHEALAALDAIRATQICPEAKTLTPEAVCLARSHGLCVRAWGVRDHASVRHLIACGADGATINYPDWPAAVAGDAQTTNGRVSDDVRA
jgi:glycerophosphoryl diester phosphodiesterase